MESETFHQSVNMKCINGDFISNEEHMEPNPINKEDDDVQKESKKAKICT